MDLVTLICINFFWHKENTLQNKSEYTLLPTGKEMLFFTHPYRATWPRGLSAGSGRPCTTRAGPASSRGSKSSWKRNIRFMSQHSTYDALYMLAFTMSMRLRCIRDRTLFARREKLRLSCTENSAGKCKHRERSTLGENKILVLLQMCIWKCTSRNLICS